MDPDLDLRKLRYFVAVAELEHFGRAADALHIAQPVLSRQIRALETDLDARLFDRDTRGTRLTAAGQALLRDARELLSGVEAIRSRVHDAATGVRRFTVGFTLGVPITDAVRELSRRHTDVSVDVMRMNYDHRASTIRHVQVESGTCTRRYPGAVRRTALHRTARGGTASRPPPRRQGDRRARRSQRRAHVLLDVPEWQDHFVQRDSPLQPPPPSWQRIEEMFEHVAAGRGVVVLPLSLARYLDRPDVTRVPVALASSQPRSA